ncbi:hypothetical protein CFOL_v3_28253 [Cephalotus follicularis]|uniref:Uncharacterized protein n=1 Tax=Cephalotus follicularis TaxID=3775 RepID=A0A1Q3CXE3_CEPFO|nr:hypothetical protein CFOL_v3_28253 [Cephalotus follicularis]
MQHPAVSEGIMEDEDSVEIIGFKTDLKKRGYKQGSKKQSMNKRYNPLLKQDCVNGYLTRSKKYKVDDQVEIVDLDVKESSQGKTREREMCNTHGLLLDKTKAQQQNQYQNAKLMQVPVHDHKGTGSGPSDIDLICSCGNIHVQSKNGEPKKNFGEQEEVTGKCEDGLEIIVSKRFFLWYPKRSQDRKRAIRAVKLFKPISPSFLVILRQHCAIRTELVSY